MSGVKKKGRKEGRGGKIAHPVKDKEGLKIREKSQSIDTNTKLTEMLALFDNDFKPVVIKMLLWLTSLNNDLWGGLS